MRLRVALAELCLWLALRFFCLSKRLTRTGLQRLELRRAEPTNENTPRVRGEF